MSTIKLNNGKSIPVIGLGTWKSRANDAKMSVISAIKNGYRHIDTAMIYENESEIGEALKECIPSICKREDLFITTKLWVTDFDDVETAIKISLKKLGLEYVDLYLIHWPVKHVLNTKRDPNDISKWCPGFEYSFENFLFSPDWLITTWRQLESCVEKGLTKSIGISNFSISKIEELLKISKIKPVINQFEIHPGLNQQELVDYCLSKDIKVTAYCPLGRPGRPDSNDPGAYAPFLHPSIISLCSKYGKSPSQIILKWGIQRGTIVIPKSVSEERIKENILLFDFTLSNEDMILINKMNVDYRLCNGDILFKDKSQAKHLFE